VLVGKGLNDEARRRVAFRIGSDGIARGRGDGKEKPRADDASTDAAVLSPASVIRR
jgi:hypothetical protein